MQWHICVCVSLQVLTLVSCTRCKMMNIAGKQMNARQAVVHLSPGHRFDRVEGGRRSVRPGFLRPDRMTRLVLASLQYVTWYFLAHYQHHSSNHCYMCGLQWLKVQLKIVKDQTLLYCSITIELYKAIEWPTLLLCKALIYWHSVMLCLALFYHFVPLYIWRLKAMTTKNENMMTT